MTHLQKTVVDLVIADSRMGVARRHWGRIEGLVFSAGGQIVAALTALLSVRVYTELLDQAEFGLAMAAMGALALLDGVVTMALNQTLLSICAQVSGVEPQRRIAVTLAFRLMRTFSLGVLPLAIVAPLLARGVGVSASVALAPVLVWIYVVEEAAKTAMLAPMAARREYARCAVWTAFESMATFAGTAAGLAARPDALGFLGGFVLGRLASTAVLSAPHGGLRYFIGAAATLDVELAARALSYGLPVSAMAPLGWVGAYLDRYALTLSAGLASAGVYSAAAGVIGRPYAVVTAVLTNYFRPLLFARAPGANPRGALARHARLWIAAAAGVGLSGSLAIYLMSGLIARVALAPDYRPGASAILIALSLAQTFTIMTHAADNAVLSTGASARLLRLQVYLVFVSLAFVPLGAWWARGAGAALGRMAAEAVKFAATAALLARLQRSEAS